MSVYVINQRKEALMPTTYRKARMLLKQGKANVVEIKPFTIQLLYATGETKQEIRLGIDSGYLNIGFSAVTNKEELISGEVKLLQGIKDRLQEKSMYRRIRRQRLRYRKPRWNNRTKSKPKGWLALSLQHKLDSHIKFVGSLYKILPISKTVIEVANFDIQKIKNPDIQGEEYQQGEQLGFYNLREYILHRDNHKCQNTNCKNNSKEKILELHHIQYQSEGGSDRECNLITLCTKCHTSTNHKKGKLLWNWMIEKKKVRGFKDATFMSTVRWYLVNKLKERRENISITYGYITKNHRIRNGIKKSHCNDAFAITKGVNQVRSKVIYNVQQVRRNNRSLEKFYDAKYIDIRTGDKISASELNCGRRTRNKSHNGENLKLCRDEKVSKGQRRIRKGKSFYQPNDLVKYDGKIYTVRGSQNGGKYIALREIKKVPKVDLIAPYRFMKGFVY